jgi:hypothetical protein
MFDSLPPGIRRLTENIKLFKSSLKIIHVFILYPL